MIDHTRETSPAPLALAAAVTLAVAPVGGSIDDRLCLALIPAAVLVFLAVGALHTTWDGRDGPVGTIGAAALRIGCIGLLATAIAGLVVVAVRGAEPTWLTVAALVSAVPFLIGEVVFGVAAAWRRAAPRCAAIVFAIAIPLGVAIDMLPQILVPIPFFFTGAGVYVGLGLLAVSTARLGWAARRRRGTKEDDHPRSTAAEAPAR
jgi:hypothetical protein